MEFHTKRMSFNDIEEKIDETFDIIKEESEYWSEEDENDIKISLENQKNYIELTIDVKRALALYGHLMRHKKVQEAPLNPGQPMCKICNKTATQILQEEGI